MERLTKKFEHSEKHSMKCAASPTCPRDCECCTEIDRIVNRLGAYEDTGLTPESVEALKLSMMGKAISEIKEFNGADMPAADVAPVRHGHWIEEGDCQICSECGEEHCWDEYRSAYCDSCGAKMDGKDGDDNAIDCRGCAEKISAGTRILPCIHQIGN